MRRSRIGLLAGLSALAMGMAGTGVAGATTVPGCAGATTGGDWPSYSGALPQAGSPGGNRSQPGEQAITTANVSNLGLAWQLATPDGGLIHDTPTVADGCVFFGTDLGTVVAANADTGQIAWQNKLADDQGSNFAVGDGVVGSPTIANGLVYVGVTAPNLSVEVALDEATGNVVWSTTIDTASGTGIDSSPVPFDTGGGPMLFQSYLADESHDQSNPGYDILNATTGAIVYAGKIIPAADYANGDRGGSIDDTPTIDQDAKILLAGTGNPASVNQNPITDSEVKIDLDPSSSTFGQIVGSARGTSDSYPAPTDTNLPTCPTTRYEQWPAGPFSCDQLDMDFLASGVLTTNSSGNQIYAELQKSGVMQAVNTSDMSVAWKATLGYPCFGCNLGSAAADADSIYVATSGGNLFALNKDTGAIKWAVDGTGVYHFNGVTVANGVVYNVSDLGVFEAINASNGVPLLAHPLTTDPGGPYQDGENSDGISVARDTVYVASGKPGGGSTLFAFKPGAGSGGITVPPLPSPPPPPGTPAVSQSVITAPGATNTTFATPAVVIRQGDSLNYTNLDTVSHNVTSTTPGLFASNTTGVGNTVPISGVDKLPPGTYSFYCSLHPWMTGQIIVEANPVSSAANRKASRNG